MTKNTAVMLLLACIAPFTLSLSPYFLLTIIALEILCIFKYSSNPKTALWLTFLLTNLYFGISVFNFKLYDMVTLVIGLYIIIEFSLGAKSIKKKFIPYFLFSFLFIIYITLHYIYGISSSSDSFLEYSRYIFSFLVVIFFIKMNLSKKSVKEIVDFVPILALKNLISGFVVFYLSYQNNKSFSYQDAFLQFENYYVINEFRLVGFFSDPNKYYLYFIAIYLMIEIYKHAYKKNVHKEHLVKLILIFGMVSSLSRTAIVIVAVIIAAEIMNKILAIRYKNFKLPIYLLLITLSVFSVQYLKEAFDKIVLYNLTKIMGRESAFIYSPSLDEDARVLSSKQALESLKDNWLIGNGLYSWPDYYYMPPHNTFVSVIQDLGLIGFLLFLLCFISIKKFLKIEIFLALIIIPVHTLDLQSFRLYYFLLAFSIYLQVSNQSNQILATKKSQNNFKKVL